MQARLALPAVAPFLLFATILFFGCDEERSGPARIVEMPEDLPDEESYRTSILVNDSNRTTAILHMGHARKYNDRFETLIDSGIAVRFLGDDGGINATLNADSARIDDKTGDMCAFGNVVVYSPGSRRIVRTESICYSKADKRLHSEAAVDIRDSIRRRHITGIGYESDDALRAYTIFKPTATVEGLD
jgi:hypothetical protein